MIEFFKDWILHLDENLENVVHAFGPWTYLFLFLVIFCETGLVVTPYLPGDSLLFAAGAIAAKPSSTSTRRSSSSCLRRPPSSAIP